MEELENHVSRRWKSMGNLEGTSLNGKAEFHEKRPIYRKKSNKQQTYVLKVSTLRNLRFENALSVLLVPILSMHVWYICLHLVDFLSVGKYTATYHTRILWDMMTPANDSISHKTTSIPKV